MIIDIHAHLAVRKIYPDSFVTGMINHSIQSGNGTYYLPEQQVIKFSNLFLNDINCARLLHQMDLANITTTVLLIIDAGVALGEADLTIEEIFELHYQVMRTHPERIVIFGGIDPSRGERGYQLFRKSVIDYGFSGLKLYPPMGFNMSDNKLTRYYQLCADYKLPVLLHTGPSLDVLKNDLANPIDIYEAARNFKHVNFILAHAGYMLTPPIIELVNSLPNIYLDIAGFYKHFKIDDKNIDNTLGTIFSKTVNHKILFGTDWPLFNIFSPLKNQINLLRQLYERLKDRCDTDALDNVLYKNALSILNTR